MSYFCCNQLGSQANPHNKHDIDTVLCHIFVLLSELAYMLAFYIMGVTANWLYNIEAGGAPSKQLYLVLLGNKDLPVIVVILAGYSYTILYN